MAQFEIVEMTAAGPQSANLGVFPDGNIAASLIPALLIQYPGRKFQPRPIKDETVDWRAREQARMADRILPPWALEPIEDHFAHVDPNNSDNVMFTPDEHYGKLDRRQSIHCRVYMNCYYDHFNLTDDERREFVWQFTGHETSVAFTQDADRIESIYTNGPNSRMAYSASDFATCGVHPSRAYAGPDLSVAYIGNEEAGYTARCVVWQEKKIYARIYGDDLQMTTGLEALGYRRAVDQSEWQGARMRTQFIAGGYDEGEDDYAEGWLMPYLDFATNVRIDETGDTPIAVIDEWGTQQGRNTNGLSEDDYCYCRGCQNAAPSGKFGHTSDTRQTYCHKCLAGRGYVRDLATGTWYPTAGDQLTALGGGDYILTSYLLRGDFTFVCPVTNERWARRRGVSFNNRLYSPEGLKLLQSQKEAA